MAQTNADGARANAWQRAGHFVANGGGTVTYRVLVSAMSLIIATLVGLMWNDLRAGINQMNAMLLEQGRAIAANTAAIAVHEQRLNQADAARGAIWLSLRGNAGQLTDHEHRITVLETRRAR